MNSSVCLQKIILCQLKKEVQLVNPTDRTNKESIKQILKRKMKSKILRLIYKTKIDVNLKKSMSASKHRAQNNMICKINSKNLSVKTK